MTMTTQRYAHISTRSDWRSALRARGVVQAASLSRPEPPVPQAVATQTEARGFVVYVGMEEAAALAAGTTLTRLADELRRYVESIAPGTRSNAAVAMAPVGAPGSDLDVVRQVFGDPTMPAGALCGPLPLPVAVSPQRQGAVIDLARREVRLDGVVLHLTGKEFELLRYLVEHEDRTIAREELIDALWRKADGAPSERTIDVHIRRLRTKLGRMSSIVRTARGQGYRFYEHPDVAVETATAG
jgi:DNA-binding winged helix-turn-helix (wHTH) protein